MIEQLAQELAGLSVSRIRQVVAKYNRHLKISGHSGLSKEALIGHILQKTNLDRPLMSKLIKETTFHKASSRSRKEPQIDLFKYVSERMRKEGFPKPKPKEKKKMLPPKFKRPAPAPDTEPQSSPEPPRPRPTPVAPQRQEDTAFLVDADTPQAQTALDVIQPVLQPQGDGLAGLSRAEFNALPPEEASLRMLYASVPEGKYITRGQQVFSKYFATKKGELATTEGTTQGNKIYFNFLTKAKIEMDEEWYEDMINSYNEGKIANRGETILNETLKQDVGEGKAIYVVPKELPPRVVFMKQIFEVFLDFSNNIDDTVVGVLLKYLGSSVQAKVRNLYNDYRDRHYEDEGAQELDMVNDYPEFFDEIKALVSPAKLMEVAKTTPNLYDRNTAGSIGFTGGEEVLQKFIASMANALEEKIEELSQSSDDISMFGGLRWYQTYWNRAIRALKQAAYEMKETGDVDDIYVDEDDLSKVNVVNGEIEYEGYGTKNDVNEGYDPEDVGKFYTQIL